MPEYGSNPDGFPLYAHNIKPFDILATRIGDTEVLSDVIGMVYRLTDILTSKSGHDCRRQIFIKNESDKTAIVTLWGDVAENFNAESLYEASKEKI